ncbi:unnamed protein product [Rotaria sp. Silwood1]|nr:unnamed protein product [Rotaria sp. Silwood1]
MGIINESNHSLSFSFDDDTDFSHKLNIIQGCIYIPIFCAGIANNLLTILIILLNRDMHTVTNCYLLNLAISDSLPLIVSLPFEIAFLPITVPWGQLGCKLRSLLAETSTNASILTISAFTIERYLAVCRPLHTSFLSTTRRAIKIQIFIWFIAILSSTPYLYITKKVHNFCSFDQDFHLLIKICFYISATIFFVLPVFILCILYALMARRLYSAGLLHGVRWSKISGRESYSISGHLRSIENDNTGLEYKFKNFSRSSTRSLMRKDPSIRRNNSFTATQQLNVPSMKKSAFKMLFAVVIAFIICYAPFHVQRLITSSSNVHLFSLSQQRAITIFYFISGIFYYLGSTINPIFYHLFSHKYREAWIRTMKRIVYCQRHHHHHHHHHYHHHHHHHRQYSQNNNDHFHKTCKSSTVARLVVCTNIPRPSLNKTSRTLETIYGPSNKYKTSIDMNCNKQHVLRLSLPTFNTERIRL